MPTLCFVGDVHGQLTQTYSALMAWMDRSGTKIDAVVQVGDLGVFRRGTSWSTMWHNRVPAPIPTWAIMGNHEDPLMIREWTRNPLQIPDMHLLYDGAIADVLGVRIGALWGNYSPISWLDQPRVERNRETGENERIAMHIDRVAFDRLMAEDKESMDVLVTHDSASSTLPGQFRGRAMDPAIKSILGLTPNEDVGGCPGITTLLKAFKPGRYFFGHVHAFEQGYVGSTRYTCLNAMDYPGGPWFEVVAIPAYGDTADATGGIDILGGGN